MVVYCKTCGAEFNEDVKYCPSCGHINEQTIFSTGTQDVAGRNMSQQPMPSQMGIAGQTNQKSKRKIIAAIIGIIIIVSVICAVFFIFFASDDPSKFYGSWKVGIDMGMGESTTQNYMTFYEDGKLRSISTSSSGGDTPDINSETNDDEYTITVSLGGTPQWGSWEVKNGKLYLKELQGTGSSTAFPGGIGLEYNFINDNKFTVSFMMFPMTFTKVDESEIETGGTGEEILWENINISLTSFGEDEHYSWINLSRSSTPYSGDVAPSAWGAVQNGDVIEIGKYDGSISGSIIWVPTGDTIDFFSFWNDS